MKERIQEYMDYKSINAGELANRLEVQRSNISHILNGRNKPSAAFIEKMLNVFPDLNARWLLTGEGSMIYSNIQPDLSIMSTLAPKTQEKTETIQPPIEKEKEKEKEKEEVKVEKQRKSTLQDSPAVSNSPKQDMWDNDIDRIVLFHKDGTFSTYTGRQK